jgi:hypothetical protein
MTTRSATTKWVKKISAKWQKTLAGIFETGDELLLAKDELERGQFGRMIENELPFSARTAERLMEIARDSRLRNPTRASHLPRSWATLYTLTRLSDEEFTAGIVDGTINSEMERADVASARSLIRVQVGTSQPPSRTVVTPYYPSEPKQEPVRTLHVQIRDVPQMTALPPELSAAHRQALRVIESLLSLEDEEIAAAAVALLHEPTRWRCLADTNHACSRDARKFSCINLLPQCHPYAPPARYAWNNCSSRAVTTVSSVPRARTIP